jgi:hypothetical protein
MKTTLVGSHSAMFAAGLGLVLGLGGCSSKSPDTGSGSNGESTGGESGFGGGNGGSATSNGGSLASNGGSFTGGGGISVGNGGSVTGGGGTPITGNGGDTTGGGGTPAGNGGTTSGGGGDAGTVTEPDGGGVTLQSCDQRTESSAKPLTQPCGDFTTVEGKNIKLGPYGAVMEQNVGTGFENPDPMDSANCPTFAAIFAEPAAVTSQLLDTGPLDFKLYTVYRPAKWPAGKIPVITWGNGTCAQPEGYGGLLRYVASFGYFVVAANSREVGNGQDMLHGLDYAAAANMDSSSPYFGHLDMTEVGAMGHSQGGAATVTAAADARVKDVIIFNAALNASKPFLAISGDLDITGYTAAQMSTAVMQAPQGAYLFYHNPAGASGDSLRGHLVLMLTPERVIEPTVAFWDMLLKGSATAKNEFVGSSCGLCSDATDYAFGEHGF